MSDTRQSWLDKLKYFFSKKPQSQSDLIKVLQDSQQRQLINHDTLKMIEGVLGVSDKKVRDIMVPRSQMIAINIETTPESMLPLIIESQHSRFPIIADDPDKVVGIILAKDFLQFSSNSLESTLSVHDIVRPAVFVPESKKLDMLLKEFKMNHNHMAIVVDEYGSVSGLVTIEDVLEEIVGEIEDEYDVDEKEPAINQIDKQLYIVNALTTIADFNDYFGSNLSDSDVDTIGGFVSQKLGYLPKKNEKTTINNFEITVIKASKRGIQSLQFEKLTKSHLDKPL